MKSAAELRSIIEAAEQAASACDYASAAQYLRRAALLQETQLGPRHRDLANTLNNLGIVYENAGQPADAEECYRRAHAIATSTLAPDDPFVLTSRQNLRDFCAAQGRAFEPIPPALAAFHAEPARVDPLRASAVPVATSPRLSRLGVGMTIVGGLALALFVVLAGPWAGARNTPARPEPEGLKGQVEIPSPAPARPEPEGLKGQVEAAPSPPAATVAPPPPTAAAATVTAESRISPEREPSPPPASSRATVALAEAQLCRSLSTANWQCAPAVSPASPGPLFFFTRLRSSRDTTVQHRWYYEGSLMQAVSLRIGANQGAGYRTYSRNTVTAERSGNWRVEVRTGTGELLHEERFLVR